MAPISTGTRPIPDAKRRCRACRLGARKRKWASRLRLLRALHSHLPNSFNEQGFVAIPFATPLIMVDRGEFLHDSASLWIDSHAGRITMAMTCSWWIGCLVYYPVNAMRTFWPQMLHSNASTIAYAHCLPAQKFQSLGMKLHQ